MVMSADRGNAALRALGAGLKGAAGGVQNIQKQRQETALMALKDRQVEAAELKARPDIEQNMGWVNEGKDPMEVQRRMNQLLAVTSAKSPYLTEVPTVGTGTPTKRRVPGGGSGSKPSLKERVVAARGRVQTALNKGAAPSSADLELVSSNDANISAEAKARKGTATAIPGISQ